MPNPFEALGDGLTITISNFYVLLTPELLNYLADPVIFAITFGMVGLYYARGSEPTLGSFLYMLFYCIHIMGLYFLLSLYPITWLIILIVVIYIALHVTMLIINWNS